MSMASARLFQGIGRRIDSFQDTMDRMRFNVVQREEQRARQEQINREWQQRLTEFAASRSDAARQFGILERNALTSERRLQFEEEQAEAARLYQEGRDRVMDERWETEFGLEEDLTNARIRESNTAADLNVANAGRVRGQGGEDPAAARRARDLADAADYFETLTTRTDLGGGPAFSDPEIMRRVNESLSIRGSDARVDPFNIFGPGGPTPPSEPGRIDDFEDLGFGEVGGVGGLPGRNSGAVDPISMDIQGPQAPTGEYLGMDPNRLDPFGFDDWDDEDDPYSISR